MFLPVSVASSVTGTTVKSLTLLSSHHLFRFLYALMRFTPNLSLSRLNSPSSSAFPHVKDVNLFLQTVQVPLEQLFGLSATPLTFVPYTDFLRGAI